ncbi:hypothetical protein VTJ04DRAFT_3758 [Mycothermus thermophilus]|uniref:uncharacterized protein n=1 Tax=Humicola insolens TaxID=85995 RepID=UPI00374220BB
MVEDARDRACRAKRLRSALLSPRLTACWALVGPAEVAWGPFLSFSLLFTPSPPFTFSFPSLTTSLQPATLDRRRPSTPGNCIRRSLRSLPSTSRSRELIPRSFLRYLHLNRHRLHSFSRFQSCLFTWSMQFPVSRLQFNATPSPYQT